MQIVTLPVRAASKAAWIAIEEDMDANKQVLEAIHQTVINIAATLTKVSIPGFHSALQPPPKFC